MANFRLFSNAILMNASVKEKRKGRSPLFSSLFSLGCGWGLKIDGTAENNEIIGLYFVAEDPSFKMSKAEIIAVNEPRTIKAIVPEGLTPGQTYYLKIVTQSSAKGGGGILKNTRELRSENNLIAQ